MKRFTRPLSPEDINRVVSGRLILHREVQITNAADPSEADANSVIFLEQEKYLEKVIQSKAGLIITNSQYEHQLQDRNLIITDKPYFAFFMFIRVMLSLEAKEQKGFIHSSAVIDSTVKIGENCIIRSGVVIEANVIIGANSIIDANSVIMADSVLGENTRLYPNVTVYNDSKIGNRVILHSGVVIGADGFGYLLYEGKQEKLPQIGNVIIEDDVEIGASTTIDRGAIGSTIIGIGTKIDNLVQIGHNCIIGKHSIICAQAGLAGSTIIGDYVYLAGQVGIAGHLTIGDKAMVGAQSGVASDLEAGGKYFGYPARDAKLTMRIMAVEKNLPEMYRYYTQMMKQEKGNNND